MWLLWHIPDDRVILLKNEVGLPRALKRQLLPPRELKPGEKIEEIPYSEFNPEHVDLLIKVFLIGKFPDDAKSEAIAEGSGIAKASNYRFYNDSLRPVPGKKEERDPADYWKGE